MLEYLSENNIVTYENTSLTIGTNLYTARLQEIAQYPMELLAGNLNIQTLDPVTYQGYHPSEAEQVIYFTVQNSNNVLREWGHTFNARYSKEMADHSKAAEVDSRITMIISMLTILVVGAIISPILSNTEERKYMAF